MIPRLTPTHTLDKTYQTFLNYLSQTEFSGDIRDNFASRLLMSTDNSIYQILPQGVVYPRQEQDLKILFQLAQQECFREITFSPRGGGTGTNGQSLNSGIIIDCSQYLNQILELNLEEGWVRVQPGVILDQLNDYLKPYDVFFAPNLSPSSRATIGGMINTDACGKGSRIYGKTSNHLLELRWILVDGTVGESQLINHQNLTKIQQESERLGNIYQTVNEIVTTQQDLIEQTFPKIPRFMTGYNLAKVIQEKGFNLNWILAGSEGTLALITEAKLKVTPIPSYKQLIALHYPDFDQALSAAKMLLNAEPAAIETLDETLLTLAQQDRIYHQVKPLLGAAKALNLVEFVGSDLIEIQQKIAQICQNHTTGYAIATTEQEMAQLWELRKKAVGLLGKTPGNRKPIAFMEDTAVSPDNLASYVQDLKAILDHYPLNYAMYGHVDVGCLHVRPALDLKVPQDETIMQELSEKVVNLVRQYGGVMWGEHGKGFRSEYTSRFFGELYPDLRKIKAAFDPDNRLNPGKIVTPWGSEQEVVKITSPLKSQFDRQVSESMRSQYQNAFNCNGNGACFNVNPDDVMCPSYKGMKTRIHSPKGRANLVREWLRQLDQIAGDSRYLNPAPGHILTRLWNSLGKSWGISDYSHEVYEGMAGCLSCKACVSQCPINVDIPQLKGQFLELYHTRYLRPLRDYLVGYVETLAYWQSFAPRLVNMMTQKSRNSRVT
jgi:FAD/FMN-containing dehydrogenase/ferredoxin